MVAPVLAKGVPSPKLLEVNSINTTGHTAHSDHYRPDIDGLRAVAVGCVLIFHAFPNALPAGFVGVDIFFVISGYLITGLILRDLDAGRFSLRQFYSRRVRRIFPALCLVMSVSLGYGWIVLTSVEYEQLGRHVASGAAFLANFMFWREAGYFDNAADTKPMLHLWSLSIEEQFYALWPLLILLCWRRRLNLLVLCGVLTAGSIGYSVWLAGRDLVADFYSPLSRFWELLLGAVVAYLARAGLLEARFFTHWAATLGLMLLLASLVFIHQGLPFPGYWAILPTLGAALVLAASMRSHINSGILASKPMVWLGLISYPLYLWHWPLLSMGRIVESQTPGALTRMTLLVLSVGLAWMTYRYVERPIRFGKRSKHVVPLLCLWMVLLLLAGHNINRQHGFQFRHHNLLNADPATMVVGTDKESLKRECLLRPAQQAGLDWCWSDGRKAPSYIVLGDSKGDALFYGLVRESSPAQGGYMVGPITLLADPSTPTNAAIFTAIDEHPELNAIVLVNALRGIFPLNPETGFVQGTFTQAQLDDKVRRYTQIISRWVGSGRRVIFVKDNPTLPDPDSCVSGGMTRNATLNQIFFRKENPRCQLKYSEHLVGTQLYQQFVDKLKISNPSLVVFDPSPWLCDIPADLCTVAHDRKFLYSYGDHISDYASSRLARELLPLVLAGPPN